MKQHRYEQIARALSERIASGRAAVGEPLATEADLCRRYGVSRYTARAALGVLRERGLVTRRRRAGTTVAAAGRHAEFSLPVGSAEELFRYASGVRLEIEQRARVRAGARLATLLGGKRGQSWVALHGVRREHAHATPACTISVYLHAALAGLEARIPATGAVIFPMIERALGTRIAWIRQRIEAAPLAAADAARLGVPDGACGLRVLRFYLDTNERLLQCSDSRHAGGAFAYEMRLRRA